MNVDKLKGKMKEQRKNQDDIAKILNLTPKTVHQKLKKRVFKTNEMNILASYLKLSCKEAVEIFLDDMLHDTKQTCENKTN